MLSWALRSPETPRIPLVYPDIRDQFSELPLGFGTPEPLGGLAVLGTLVASADGVAEEARIRGFAAPAFAGCALGEGW
jgi:hypothetical protein